MKKYITNLINIIRPISSGFTIIYLIYSTCLYFILSNKIPEIFAKIYLNPIFKIYFLLSLYNFGSNNLLLAYMNAIYFICISYKISIDNLTKNLEQKN
jgi:hypothetical protein